MENDRLYSLISRKLSGEATRSELQELHEYFRKNPRDQYFSEIITSYWNSHEDEDSADINSDEHFNHILELADETPENEIEKNDGLLVTIARKKIWTRRVVAAASFLALISITWWIMAGSGKKTDQTVADAAQSEAVVEKGVRSKVVLPDGSVVLLNSDTKLRYPQKFQGKFREVFLDGEAFFDVKKQPDHPFIVTTSGIQIKVLGTIFNVKAYSADKIVETSLIQGSIEVSVKNRPGKITLSPNEKMVIKNFELPVRPGKEIVETIKPSITVDPLKADPKDNTFKETQWIQNKLVFREEPFDEAVRMLERWYNISIELADEEMGKEHVNGTFTTETIEQTLEALEFMGNFHYQIKGSIVKIYK